MSLIAKDCQRLQRLPKIALIAISFFPLGTHIFDEGK
jgi:hypothetical protein